MKHIRINDLFRGLLIIYKLRIKQNARLFRKRGVVLGKHSNIQGTVGLEMQGGTAVIGDHFTCQSGMMTNPLGVNINSYFRVGPIGKMVIGNNVGLSSTSIWCNDSITIEDNVMIGARCLICDNDCHSMDPVLRLDSKTDACNAKSAPIIIKKNAFIGASCVIFKGVTIGENSIVGIGSVVTKSIPDNQIWAGNPAKFIKNL